MIDRKLIRAIRDQFVLDWQGIHGVRHWVRVRQNGLELCERTGANKRVVELFAFLHDSQRQSDGDDTEHGERAAEFAASLAGTHIHLEKKDLALLIFACAHHSSGSTEGDITVQTCWDADRLDLGRVATYPDSKRLCTPAARDPWMIRTCYERSKRWR